MLSLPKATHFGEIARQIANPDSEYCRELEATEFRGLIGLKRSWRWWQCQIDHNHPRKILIRGKKKRIFTGLK